MKNICKKITALVIIGIFLTSFNISLAVTQAEINDQKNQQQQNNNKIKETEQKKEEVQEQKDETLKEVEQLNTQITDYQGQISSLESQISDANAKIKESEVKISQSQKEYDDQQKKLEERIVAVYESGETSYLDVLLNSESITDFISNYYLVSEITQYDKELLGKIQKQKEEIENAKKELEASKNTLTTAKSEKESVNNQLKSAKSEKDAKVSQLSAEEQELQKELDELKNHESSISSKILQMQREYDAQKASNTNKNQNNNSGSLNNNASSSYGFGWPVANHSIGTGFGVSGKYWSSGYHTGIDFPVPSGTTVYAVGDGQVFDTGYNRAYGNFVEIYHGNNVYSFYAHGTSVSVSVGQKVSKGQVIMSSGATGNVTGAHLHFEIRTPGYKYANCVNPRPYLP